MSNKTDSEFEEINKATKRIITSLFRLSAEELTKLADKLEEKTPEKPVK